MTTRPLCWPADGLHRELVHRVHHALDNGRSGELHRQLVRSAASPSRGHLDRTGTGLAKIDASKCIGYTAGA